MYGYCDAFIDNMVLQATKTFQPGPGQLPPKMKSSSAVWQDTSHDYGRCVHQNQTAMAPGAVGVEVDVFKVHLRFFVFVSSVISLHGIFAIYPLTWIRMSMCFFRIVHVLDFPSVLHCAESKIQRRVISSRRRRTHEGISD